MTVTNAEIMSALSSLTEIIAGISTRVDGLEGESAQTEAPKAKSSKKRTGKSSARTTTSTKETTVSKDMKTLTKNTRRAFIKAHDWAQDGQSVPALSTLALTSPKKHPLKPGWKVATHREAKHVGLTTSEFVARRDAATVVAAKPARGKAANTRKSRKVVEVETQRNALGQITPKVEWALRAELKAEGFSPKAVDKKVRKARNKGLIAA